MNHCHNRGYIVDASTEVPADEHVYARPGEPLVGCNRIACSVCGAAVRQWRGVRQAEVPHTRAEHEALYATTDPDASRFLTRDHSGQRFRVYACRCSATETSNARDLAREILDIDWWACAGHPEPA